MLVHDLNPIISYIAGTELVAYGGACEEIFPGTFLTLFGP